MYLPIDPTTDKNFTVLAQLSQRYEFPDFVKSADIDETLMVSDAPAYAWPQRKLYPCHSAAATWLSAAYFHDKLASFGSADKAEIERRLQHFADFFNISDAYEQLAKVAREKTTKAVLADEWYAFVSTDEAGNKTQAYPLTDGTHVKAAVAWLRSLQDSVPLTSRQEIGQKVLHKQQQLGAKLAAADQEFLERQSGTGRPDRDGVIQGLEIRARLAKTAEQREQIGLLAAAIRTTPEFAMTTELTKLATTIDTLDLALGLTGKYSEGIKRPEDLVFAITPSYLAEKQANTVALQNGSVFAKDQLSQVSYDDLREVLGDDFAAEVSHGFTVDTTKLAEIASTLPRPDAQLLETILRSAGEAPRAFSQIRYEMA
jgi:hypothetical protein